MRTTLSSMIALRRIATLWRKISALWSRVVGSAPLMLERPYIVVVVFSTADENCCNIVLWCVSSRICLSIRLGLSLVLVRNRMASTTVRHILSQETRAPTITYSRRT